MPKKFRQLAAILLVFAVTLSFAACKGGDTDNTTAPTTQEATEAGGTTAPPEETTGTDESTTENGETTTGEEETSTGTESTTAKPGPDGINAPVGGTKAQIVAFYNQYANATKEYKGKVTVKRDMGTVTEITKMALFKSILQRVLDRQLEDESKTKTFNNGYVSGDKNDTLPKFLPRGAGKPMSELVPAGVKSATCVKSGSGWKVTITLYKEIVSGLNTPPKHHTSVMDPMTIDPKDLDPFTIGEGKVTYGDINSKDTGASLVAVFNDKGYLESLNLDAPLRIAGKLGFNNKGIDTVIDGKWWGKMTFTY